MGPRYNALTTISVIYKIIAALAFIGTILSTLAALSTASSLSSYGYNSYGSILGLGGFIGAVGVFLAGSVVSLGIYAIGELFELLVELAFNTRSTEANSRATNAALQNQTQLMTQNQASFKLLASMAEKQEKLMKALGGSASTAQATPESVTSEPPIVSSDAGTPPTMTLTGTVIVNRTALSKTPNGLTFAMAPKDARLTLIARNREQTAALTTRGETLKLWVPLSDLTVDGDVSSLPVVE